MKLDKYAWMGTGSFLDPIRPTRMGTIAARVANMCAVFDKLRQKYPAGFTIDKGAFLQSLGTETLTVYARRIFRKYGYKFTVYRKKPYVDVKHEDISNNRQSSHGNFIRKSDRPVGKRDGDEASSSRGWETI